MMMMMPKPSAQTSPGSVLSLRPTAPGSPLTITARVDGGVIGYKDLAALPRDKAILEIERPDLMLYQPHYCYSPIESSLSPYSVSPPPSPEHTLKETRDWLDRRSGGGSSPSSTNQSRTHSSMSTPTTPQTTPTPAQTTPTLPQHFHRPENGSNIYKKPPIYKQASSPPPPPVRHIEDLIIESSKFPSAQAPDPNQPSAIETESWPCPPSSAVIEQERRGPVTDEDEDEETDEFYHLRVRHSQLHQAQIPGNLGKILLKDEKGSVPMRRKKTRSLPERTTGSKSARSNAPRLSSLQSTEFSQSDAAPEGLQNGDRGASLPSMIHHKVFPYATLVVTHRGRRTLPPEVDRTQLERHLSEDEFFSVFRMTLQEFDKLSLWKRNELKKRVCLF